MGPSGKCVARDSTSDAARISQSFAAGRFLPARDRCHAMIVLRRVYDPTPHSKGRCFLVERLWPRGVKKDSLDLDGWLKDAAPGHQLRRWFGHDPAKWDEFQKRYFAELDSHPKAWEPLLEAARHGTVELLYSSRDTEHNNAVALKRYLEAKLARGKQGP
jgi:uncharacterized protein YeaO (DUF488 family)